MSLLIGTIVACLYRPPWTGAALIAFGEALDGTLGTEGSHFGPVTAPQIDPTALTPASVVGQPRPAPSILPATATAPVVPAPSAAVDEPIHEPEFDPSWDTTLAPAASTEQWFRLGAMMRLRESPSEDAAVLTTMPRGAFVRALIGTVDGHESSTGSHGTWARVFPTGSLSGWAGGNLLTQTRTVAPTATELLGQLDARLRAEAASNAFVGDLSTEGEPLWYVAACAASEPAVYVGFRAGSEAGGPPTLTRTEGRYEDLAFVRRPESAPDAFVLLATQRADVPAGTLRWTLFAPGSTVAGWTLDAATGRDVPEAQRARFDTTAPSNDPTRVLRFRFADHTAMIVRSDGRTFTSERVSD